MESKKKTEEPSKAEFKSKREMTNPFVISHTQSDESRKPSPLSVMWRGTYRLGRVEPQLELLQQLEGSR